MCYDALIVIIVFIFRRKGATHQVAPTRLSRDTFQFNPKGTGDNILPGGGCGGISTRVTLQNAFLANQAYFHVFHISGHIGDDFSTFPAVWPIQIHHNPFCTSSWSRDFLEEWITAGCPSFFTHRIGSLNSLGDLRVGTKLAYQPPSPKAEKVLMIKKVFHLPGFRTGD